MKTNNETTLKDGIFYTRLNILATILQYNSKDTNKCSGYWEHKWLTNYWGFNDETDQWREATYEELEALGTEHRPYSKYLLGDKKETFLTTLDGVAVNIDDNVAWVIRHEDGYKFSYMLRLCERHKALLERKRTVYFIFSTEDEAKEFVKQRNEIEFPKHTNLKQEQPVYSQLVKEAKELRRFKSGAVRSSDRGRLRPDYISPYALEEIAQHFTEAAKEFGSDDFATNYFKGVEPKDVKGSISRHYLDLQKAFAEKDNAKVREELRAIACNCIMALHQIRIEELGLYVEEFESTEYITAND